MATTFIDTCSQQELWHLISIATMAVLLVLLFALVKGLDK